jgi:DNA polymerase IV
LTGLERLRPHVHAQALRVGRRLRKAGVRGRVVQLKIKFADFNVITRRTTLSASTDDGQALYGAALELLERAHQSKPVRLTGVSVQSLNEEGAQQLGLFSAPPARSTMLNATLDRIAERFGSNAITTADLTQGSAAVDEDERWGRH